MDEEINAMLTKDDRSFLRGEKTYSGEHAKQQRYQRRRSIRDRVHQSVIDFSLLMDHLPEEEREKIFGGAQEGIEDEEFVNGLRDTLAFVLYGTDISSKISDNSRSTLAQKLLESALQRVGMKIGETSPTGPFIIENVTLDIESEKIPIPNLKRDLKEGRELPPESLRLLLELDEVDTSEIQEIIHQMLLDKGGED